MIAAGIALLPAVLSILQKETGLALVYFSFFLVMYREGLSPIVLIIGFTVASLVVATIVVEPNTLAIVLTLIAGLVAYIMRRHIKRRKSVLVRIVFLWVVCVSIQRFAVPFIFTHVLQKHQVERIFSLFGKDNPYSNLPADIANAEIKKEGVNDYNVKQSKIAIGSGGLIGKGLLSGTQTRYFVRYLSAPAF
jgi:rod shape determining protein RodA